MELFKLLGTISVENTDALNALQETSVEGEKTKSRLSNSLDKIGGATLKVGKTVAKGMAVGCAAMGTLTVAALNMGGELEQNMGGSEAVFGKYAEKMQERAKTAFSEMGLSTSDYLATANKMGALFQGAGFDIEESMNLSSDAMQRAADVASIMGIDTSAAMEAVAGAAKGNFTMMDNLGVAMNDTTLNAFALEKGLGKTTQEMTNQEKIGLAMELFMEKTAYAAGNYAKENETLAGSLGTAKSALTNFLDGSGDVEQVVDSFSNAANVIVEKISEIAPRLVSGLSDLITQIMPLLPPLMNQLLPVVIEGAVGLINGLVEAIPSIMEALMAALPALIDGMIQIVTALTQALPQVIQTFVAALPTIIPALIEGLISLTMGIVQALPQIIQALIEAIPTIITLIITSLIENLPAIISGLIQVVGGIITSLPDIFGGLIDGIGGIFSGIWNTLGDVFGGIGNWFSEKFSAAKEAASNAWSDAKEKFSEHWGNVKEAFSNVGGWFKEKFTEGRNKSKEAWANAKSIFSSVWTNIKGAFTNVGGWFKEKFTEGRNKSKEAWANAKTIFSGVWSNVKGAFSNVGGWFKEKFTEAKNNSTSAWADAKDKFTDVKEKVAGAFSDIKEKLSGPFEKAKEAISKVAEKIKGFFSGEIQMPKIKLPHFGITPAGWKISDLLKGSIPKLTIDWYAKAMDNPMIMEKPTAFGINANGQVMAGGEAGSEVVSGTETLMNMISAAVAAQNEELINIVKSLFAFLQSILPDMANVQLVMDSGAIVGELAPGMNKALGKIAHREGRRV